MNNASHQEENNQYKQYPFDSSPISGQEAFINQFAGEQETIEFNRDHDKSYPAQG